MDLSQHIKTVDTDELDVMELALHPLKTRSQRHPHATGDPDTRDKSQKRQRTKSILATQNNSERTAVKKQKVEDKKAVTVVVNLKRAALDVARKRWLHRHRPIFEPLLRANSVFFDNLQKEVNAATDKGAYEPIHQLDEQPKLIKGGFMKDYQLQGLSFLVYMYNNGMNCILGDEMGLGKTLQTLSLFAYIKESTKDKHDPHLIVCPLSVLSSWMTEASRWLPSFRTVRFHGQKSERDRLKNTFRNDENQEPFDLLITTYETFVAEDSWFKTRRWTYVVLDEGHKIKNSESNMAHKVQGLGGLFRLILTGTPVQNNLVELWGLLHWLYPTLFTPTTERLFKDSFAISRGEYSIPFLVACEKLLSVIMLRRTKANVEMSVPPREELTVFIPLTEAQRFWYYRLLTKMDTMDLREIFGPKLEEGGANKGRNEIMLHLASQMEESGADSGNNKWNKLMNLLMQLRKVCDHPYLIPHAEPDPFVNGEHLVAASSKLMVIDKLLADILPKGEQVLIFSQWTKMLDLLEDFMALREIPYARLDGSTTRPRRTWDIKLFQRENSPYKVFLISTKAGGLGINLTKASTVIMCDLDWNPQSDLQAIARAHRIGQTKTVKVYRLVCRGSVEDQMLDRLRRKLFLSVKVMGADNNSSGSDNSILKAKELMNILRKGSSALSRSDDGMDISRFLSADIEEILNASRKRENIRDAKVKQELSVVEVEDEALLRDAEAEEAKLLSGVGQVQSRMFEGQLVPLRNNKDIAREWKSLQKRARVDRTVVIDGITVIAAHVGPEAPSAVVKTAPKARTKYDWEDWCNYCREGGELVLCSYCPRVFHAECHDMTKEEVRRSSAVACAQHACVDCQRSTADAGGTLFRCRTCPQAFCEDCLPDDHIENIGDTLPEFLVLNYGEKDNAYYIRCHDCYGYYSKHPEEWAEWEREFRVTQERLEGK